MLLAGVAINPADRGASDAPRLAQNRMRALACVVVALAAGAALALTVPNGTIHNDECLFTFHDLSVDVAYAMRYCRDLKCTFSWAKPKYDPLKCLLREAPRETWLYNDGSGCYMFKPEGSVVGTIVARDCRDQLPQFACDCRGKPRPTSECGRLFALTPDKAVTAFDAMRVCTDHYCRLPTSLSSTQQECAVNHLIPNATVGWAQINKDGCWRLGGTGNHSHSLLFEGCDKSYSSVLCDCD
eukprot:m.151964 g.151964  ORF g.151964 m.151964 type:complete len:241 (+) comp10159_c2_seq3:2375-3097(+)